jgi:UDP-N-acetylmuramyl pentapeptide synthase
MAAIGKMDFRAAVDYVLSFADYERLSRSAVVFDLARVEALLARAGNPHLAAKSVHVAGTKGKGSTSAMIASVLQDRPIYLSPPSHHTGKDKGWWHAHLRRRFCRPRC